MDHREGSEETLERELRGRHSHKESGEGISPSLHAEAVKHFSAEIITELKYLASFRTRMAFTVLTGPFIIVGSLLVAFRRPLAFNGPLGMKAGIAIALTILSYFALAAYGALLDNHSTAQCDRWRMAIASLLNGKNVDESNLRFRQHAYWAYIGGFALVLLAFASLIFLLRCLPV